MVHKFYRLGKGRLSGGHGLCDVRSLYPIPCAYGFPLRGNDVEGGGNAVGGSGNGGWGQEWDYLDCNAAMLIVGDWWPVFFGCMLAIGN